ncbi:peroxisomal nicotinamide adenine dinucleotide carrier-like isoform X2 [Coffea arabica]|uniref:Peroxisomal nicotinamide adenine dinucleotide carrier-like isoform X2 n=1 Tax=Coffea arabica TaxID=13443 RepID=A0ABM4WRX1_COFAR
MSDALINGLAGAGGGIIAQLITYPLQTVNTRQQTERDPKREKRRHGTIEQMIQVVRHEGWDRLYGGLTPSLVGTAASQGVYYYFYQIFRSKAEAAALQRRRNGVGDGSVGMFSSLVVAALSGCVNVLLTNPIWVVVTRMQTHTKKSGNCQPDSTSSGDTILAALEPPPFGTCHAIQEVYDEGGVSGFWRGVFPTLIMVSNPSIQFMLYETLLKKLKKRRASSKKGFFAWSCGKTWCYGCNISSSCCEGTLDAFIKMIRYEGFYGFYKGMGTKIVQSVLAAAVLFMVKEELVRGTRWLLTKDAVKMVKSKPSS